MRFFPQATGAHESGTPHLHLLPFPEGERRQVADCYEASQFYQQHCSFIFCKLNAQIENVLTKNHGASGLQSAEFSRILLIKPSALGDVVHTIPVLVKLRARYPRARIDWLITPENAEVVRHHPALSNVVLFARSDFSKPGQKWRATLGFFDLLKQIRREHSDLTVD